MSHGSRMVGWVGVLVMLLAFAPGEGWGQKNNKKAPKNAGTGGDPASPDDYAKIRNLKELIGSLVTMDATAKTLTLRVETPHYEPNPKYKPPQIQTGGNVGNAQTKFINQQTKLMQDIQNQQQKAMNAKTPQEQQKILTKIQQDITRYQQHQALYMSKLNAEAMRTYTALANAKSNPNNQPFLIVKTNKDYTLEIHDPVVVRKLFLNFQYDDTGNVKQYSDQEKEEMRGKDKTKPGYEAKIEDAIPGQEVKLSLTAPKVKKKDKEKPKEQNKDAEVKIDDEESVYADRPTVNTIILTKDLAVSSMLDAGDAKKGKKKQ